jgi:hypothetical protein
MFVMTFKSDEKCIKCGSKNTTYFDKSPTEDGYKRCYTCDDCGCEWSDFIKK